MPPIANGIKPANASPSQKPCGPIPMAHPKMYAIAILAIMPSIIATKRFNLALPEPLIIANAKLLDTAPNELMTHGRIIIEAAVLETVDLVKNHPLVPKDVIVRGYIMDSETGELKTL